MRRIASKRLAMLEQRHSVAVQESAPMLFLLPELWPEEDRRAWETARGDALRQLVERRTGMRPNFDLRPFWALLVPPSEEMLAMTAAEKEAFLARYETRPCRSGYEE